MRDPGLPDLAEDEFFATALREAETVGAVSWPAPSHAGIPVPAYSSALGYFDAMRSERLPANLIQAQRDYLRGSHLREGGPAPRRVLPSGVVAASDKVGRH